MFLLKKEGFWLLGRNIFLMAAHSVFGFLFLLCYSLLLSAAAQGEPHEECEKHLCGSLGEISFPFTATEKPECGLQIIDCEQQVQKIRLGNQSYEICSIYQDHKYNSIFISNATAAKIYLESPQKSIFSTDNITFSICNHGSISETKPIYRQYPHYDDDLKFLPFACLPPHQPPSGQAQDPCVFSTWFLEIRVELSESCEDCYHPTSQCRLNQTYFSCVDDFLFPPPRPDVETKVTGTKDKHLKAAVIGLSIGLATVISLALFVIFFLYNRTNKSSGVQDQPRSIYSGLYRNTTHPESGAIYFGIPVFSFEELQEATNNFDQARVLGEGGFGIVYYGKLRDGREVAVKRLLERNYRPVESFINEIQILTRMRHRNLVTLYGCSSRHSRELLLVYEYVPNGTVSCHLFGDKAKHGLLPWPVRMKIAIETASALAYLHASDIIHRDVKSSNILLDNNFGVKVADFGLSRLFPHDVTHVSTAPRGTPGYVDPDYRLCYQLTSKSDVYSFGVVLVELISSLPAVDMNRDSNEINLAKLAIRKIQRRAFCELIDPSLGCQTDGQLKKMIISVAELAFQCLQGDKELRPSMDEVLEVLQRIESGKDEPGNLEGIEVHGAGVSQSYAHPSLPNTLMKPQRHHQTV